MQLKTRLRPSSFLSWFRRLTRKEKLFVFLCFLQVISQCSLRLFSVSLPFSGWLDLLFVVLAFVLGVVYLRRIIRRLLWRLRNRLIVTYILIGVVPIVLILSMLAISGHLLLGQVAAYLVTTELRRHNDMVRDTAYSLGWNVVDHLKTDSGETAARAYLEGIQDRLPNFQAVIKTNSGILVVPPDAGFKEFPPWSQPGFQGVLCSGLEYALAAHVQTGRGDHRAEVFAYEPADAQWLASLLPGMALVKFQRYSTSGLPEELGKRGLPLSFHPVHMLHPVVGEGLNLALPSAGAWWDFAVRWGTPVEVWLADGQRHSRSVGIRIESRPSLIIKQLFASLGDLAGTLKWILVVIGGLFLVVEIASLVFGVSLTRSITRAVADLYDATQKVKAGDFSRRVPIRSTDQLSELALSFNTMTENIQRLIIESKEKERLQSELEIAREVQTQLFPKKLPQLKTLELRGLCNPARVVSGDYYDCVPIDAAHTALALGDISGKGISAALLMASIQSSLRAQLSFRPEDTRAGGTVTGLSTAKLVAMLNRQLYESTTSEKFASFFYGIYDEGKCRLHYTNAGHLPPIFIRDGKATRLDISGLVIGAFPDVSYEEHSIDLRRGDLLVAFTDGITEPENEYGEEFGDRRLTELLLLNAHKPLEELIAVVTTAVNEWQSSPEPMDDMTLLLARRI